MKNNRPARADDDFAKELVPGLDDMARTAAHSVRFRGLAESLGKPKRQKRSNNVKKESKHEKPEDIVI